jgi:hypothetical protein
VRRALGLVAIVALAGASSTTLRGRDDPGPPRARLVSRRGADGLAELVADRDGSVLVRVSPPGALPFAIGE